MKDPTARPTTLNDGDLMAYIDGDASVAVVSAIEADERLLAEVAALKEAAALLDAGLERAGCPETDDLLTYQANLLVGDAVQLIAAHLETCVYCQQEMQELAIGIALDAPQSVASVGWLDALKQMGRKLIDLELRPTRQAPAFALRGHSQQLIFESDAFQVVAVLKPDVMDKVRIEGQVVNLTDPLSMPNGQAVLRQAETVEQTATLNEFGHFIMGEIAPDGYTLQIDVDMQTSVILQVTVAIGSNQ